MLQLLKKISATLFIALMAAMFIPFGSLSADQSKGTVVVRVQDENGAPLNGIWYLHQGTTIKGLVVRNGSAGETFQSNTGSYYLEARNVPGSYPYHLFYSTNPQFLSEGGSINFNVQYFETEEAMLIASGNPPAPVPVSNSVSEPEADVFDKNGCNSTQGFVWCEKEESCVKYWSPACKVTEVEAASEPEDVVVAPVSVPAQPPALNLPEVPEFDSTPPVTLNEVITSTAGIQLAQTGAPMGFVLIGSMLLGLASFRKRD